MRAIFNGKTIAESDETIVVEGNHYFPRESIREEYLADSGMRTLCVWKGMARYHDVEVGRKRSSGAAFYYPHPYPWIRKIRGHVAFWNDVRVVS